MLKYLRGGIRLQIKGADPERCLNEMTKQDIPFWDLCRLDAFCLRLTVYEKDGKAVSAAAVAKQCEAEVLRIIGLRASIAGLRRRWILIFGVAAALMASLWLQNFMWFFRTDGIENGKAVLLLRQLEEEGVRFGAWGVGLDTEDVKNRMLIRDPDLSWIAVNKDGAVVNILISEREKQEPAVERSGVYHVVASRDGIITQFHVYSGFAEIKIGDAVKRGQLLVSGITQWPTHLQALHAEAEVYAKTLRECKATVPAVSYKKVYTGRTEICKTIIFQRNRRKISGNSSIFGTMCDKMIEIKQLILPGAYSLPIWIETVTLTEYELRPVQIDESTAKTLLMRETEAVAYRQMTAGKILTSSCRLSRSEDSFCCSAQFFCEELISRSIPANLIGEEAENGETHQRRTD